MAKNTSSSAFRKINVDQYNEDNFKEDEVDTNGTKYTGPDDAEITKLLNAGKNNEALKLVLQNAPLTSKNQQTKVSSVDQDTSHFCHTLCIQSTFDIWNSLNTNLFNTRKWIIFDFVEYFQEIACQLILKVLLSIRPANMDSAIESLNDSGLADVLMKYIYRGFEFPSDNSSAHLLQWHERVFAKHGHGCISRVLTSTNRA